MAYPGAGKPAYLGTLSLGANGDLFFGSEPPDAAGSSVYNGVVDINGNVKTWFQVDKCKVMSIYVICPSATRVGTLTLNGAMSRDDPNAPDFLGPFVPITGFSLALVTNTANAALWNLVDFAYNQFDINFAFTSGVGNAYFNINFKE